MDEVEAESDLRPDAYDELAPVVLVVDDEPLIRRLVSTVLRHRGWSVLEAADGTVALTVAPETLAFLVTDHEVPAVTGVTLAEKLRQRHSEPPVLMVSRHLDASRQLRNLARPALRLRPRAASSRGARFNDRADLEVTAGPSPTAGPAVRPPND